MTFHGRKSGSDSSTPTLTADTLRSADTYEIILGLCEGPIKGPVSGPQSIEVGGTAVANLDGTTNFFDATINFFDGSHNPGYTIRPFLGGVASSTPVGTQLYSGVPIVRTTQGTNLSSVDIRLNVQQLLYQDSNGNTNTDTFSFNIDLKYVNETSWTNFYTTVINGKTSSNYVRQFSCPVDPNNPNQIEIRVTKTSPESNVNHICTVSWESFEEIRNQSYKWGGTAVLQISGRATNQFSSMPQFSGIYDGRIVRVPTNYDPVAKLYAGIWDGTFKLAYTDNNAWLLYDFITDSNYGMASYCPIYIDKYSIYEAAVWCDDRMPDGSCRYTFNELIAEPRQGREQAAYLAGTFNAAFFDDGNGTAFIKVDKDDPATHLFAEENIDGDFEYSFSDMSTRYNDITVTFTNPDLDWNDDRRRVYDEADIALNGRVPFDFIAQGCTSAAEAINRARYKLVTALTETMSVVFKTNRLGRFVRPWDVMLIADPTTGYSVSGRIKSIDGTRSVMTLRDPVYLEAGQSYGIILDTPDGPWTAALTGATAGANLTLTLTTPLAFDPPEQATFSLYGGNLGLPKPFRVLKIDEVDGSPDQMQIMGVEINRDKWASIASGTVDTPAVYNNVDLSVAPVTNLVVNQAVSTSPLGVQIDLHVRWDKSPSKWVTDYGVSYSLNGGPWARLSTVGNTEAVISNVVTGTYEIRVTAVGLTASSPPMPATYVVAIDSDTIAVASVTGLELSGQGNNTQFTGKDAKFDWRMNSPYTTGSAIGSTSGANAGYLDSWFRNYQVSVFDTVTGQTLRTETTQDPTYIYTYEKNVADGGPRRSFRVEVVVRDKLNRTSNPARLTVSNPAPQAPNVQVAGGFQTVYAVLSPAPEIDYAGTLVWMSETDGFAPSDANLIHDGTGNGLVLPAPTGSTQYLIFANYDTFGKDVLNYSTQFVAATHQLLGPDLENRILTQDKLVDDLSSTIDLITADSSVTGSVDQRISVVNSTVLTNSASIGTLNSTVATQGGAISAQATSISTLSTTVAGHTASISTQATSIDGLSAQYTVKVDVNGHVAGFGLASTAVNGATVSQFIVRADMFAVVDTSGAVAVSPFIVTGGTVYLKNVEIDGSVVVAGSSSLSTIAASAASAGAVASTAYTWANDPLARAATQATTIDGNFITTGTILADHITAGTFMGLNFQTSNTVGLKRVVIDASSNSIYVLGTDGTKRFTAGDLGVTGSLWARASAGDGSYGAAMFMGYGYAGSPGVSPITGHIPAVYIFGGDVTWAPGMGGGVVSPAYITGCGYLSTVQLGAGTQIVGSATFGIDLSTGTYGSAAIFGPGGSAWDTAGYVKAVGFYCRSGTTGSWTGSNFNIQWTGSAANLWVDSTNVGAISTTSDYRLKVVEGALTGCLDRIEALNPISHRWKNTGIFKDDGKSHHSFLAHEVQAVIPTAATFSKDSLKEDGSPEYQALIVQEIIPDIVGAIKELSAIVKSMQAH